MREASFSTFIDHFDILSVEWDKVTRAILDCGFVMDTGSNELPPFDPAAARGKKRSFKDIVKAQFVFRNCYMISTHALSKEDGLYHCYGSYDPAHPGMYHLVFGTGDIQQTYDRLCRTELTVRYEEDFQGPIGWTGRFCTNGVMRGQLVVAGVTLEKEYADMSILVNNQKSTHLLYHPGQYRHINGAERVDEMILLADDEGDYEDLCRDVPVLTGSLLPPDRGSGIKKLTVMDSEAAEARYGIAPEHGRKGQAGLVITLPDFESLDYCLAINHVPHTAGEGRRVVDLTRDTGMFFVFKTL